MIKKRRQSVQSTAWLAKRKAGSVKRNAKRKTQSASTVRQPRSPRALSKGITHYALLSVWDKKGLKPFAKGLIKQGYDLVSSGGTAKHLKAAGIKVTEVSQLTKYPPMLGGRVKTLHPLVHGGILANRSLPDHLQDMKKYGIRPIDIVVCNLYPFEQTIAKPKCSIEEAVENIDIGGPCMVRGAAKNFKDVTVVADPADYKKVLDELKRHEGRTTLEIRQKLALKAFHHTQKYDAAICAYLGKKFAGQGGVGESVELELKKLMDLRYGENPHQKAALYLEAGGNFRGSIVNAKQLHGKELSFNNIVDIDSAWTLSNYFADLVVVIVKHSNPCGAAKGESAAEAFKKALACDPVSAYGGIMAINREADEAFVLALGKLFVEAIIAPGYTPKALASLKEKKNLRIMLSPLVQTPKSLKDYKKVSGGFLIQDADLAQLGINEIKIVTKKEPALGEMEDLFFAWGVAKQVKSNAIVFVKDGATVGIGAGQMSRIDSTGIAGRQAGDKAKGAVMASDAFFPFRDNVDLAAKYGISAIIQPGGSIRDQESIDAANEHGIAMLFTGRRHFKH